MKFGEKLKEQRTLKALSQAALAKELGVVTRTIQRYEQGEAYPHSRAVYSKLSELFDVDINYFLTEDEEFLTKAAELYGKRGHAQAESLLEQTAALFAGGELSDGDMLAFMKEIQDLYFESKQLASEKYTPFRYRKAKAKTEQK